MGLRGVCGLAAVLVLSGGSAHAQLQGLEAHIGAPEVPYCADMVVRALDSPETFPGHVCRSGELERREMHLGGSGAAMIVDYGARTVVQIIPEMQAYRRMDVGDSPVGELVFPSGQIEVNRSGSDTVNGIDTTVYDLIAINDDGTRVDGRVWVSAERIVLRAEGTAMESGKQVGGGYELSNLVTGPHDRSIYQIPAGYQEMQFGVGAPPALGTDTPAVPGLPDPNALAEMMRKQGVPEAQIDAMLKQMNEIQQQLGQ